MINYALLKLKERKYIIQGLIFFTIFLFLYLILDYLNVRDLDDLPSNLWFSSNVLLNILMAFLSAILMNLSTVMVVLKSSGERSANLGFFSVLFGILTYGCTSCVVTFFAAIGISFSPTIFPFIGVLNGMIYKFLSLGLILLGLSLVLYNINKGTCKVKIKKEKKNKD